MPSLHRQDGRQYDGEVILSHVYSKNKEDKKVRNETVTFFASFWMHFLSTFLNGGQIGNVACFLEMGTENDRYDFLDLYLHRWQQEHQRILDDCGIDPERRRTRQANGNDEPRVLSASNVTYQELDFPYFQGVFNPYDWYVGRDARLFTVLFQLVHPRLFLSSPGTFILERITISATRDPRQSHLVSKGYIGGC